MVEAAYEVKVKVDGEIQAVAADAVPTAAEVGQLVGIDPARTKPIIKGRIASWLTHLVPDAIVEFC